MSFLFDMVGLVIISIVALAFWDWFKIKIPKYAKPMNMKVKFWGKIKIKRMEDA